MANGQQLSRENFETFLVWMASQSDQDFQSLESRGVLSRTKVSRECGFSKSSLDQNPHIKKALRTLESELRDRGVLPSLVKRSPDTQQQQFVCESGGQRVPETERDRQLKQGEEIAELRAEVAELKGALKRFAMISEALFQTGRILR